MDRFVDLDIIGALQDSDKSSSIRFGWDYLRHYEMLLTEYRDLPIEVLEIGVSRGGSLRSWAWFFPNASITGIDIDPACARHAAPRIDVQIGSQTDTAFLDGLCKKAAPTIIIDDGSHNYEHMILTFEHMLPKLQPGGLYIVEDIGFHYGPHVKSRGGKPNVPEYFLDLARFCMAHGKLDPTWGIPQAVANSIDRVTFIGQSVALHKHDPERDVFRGLATAEHYLKANKPPPGVAVNMAEWLLLHDGPHEKAAQLIADALAKDPNNIKLRLMQADVMLRAGHIAQARDLLGGLAARRPEAPRLLIYLATLLLKAGDPGAAEAIKELAMSAKGMKLAKEKLHTLAQSPPPPPVAAETPLRAPARLPRAAAPAAKPASRRAAQASS